MRTLLLTVVLALAASVVQAQNPWQINNYLQSQYNVANNAAYWRAAPYYYAPPAYYRPVYPAYGYGYSAPYSAFDTGFELHRIRQDLEMQGLRQSWRR